MSGVETAVQRRAERRWILIGVGVAGALLAAQLVGGLAREALTDEPSRLELVQKCLVERSVPFEAVRDDPVAASATRGALRTRVEDTPVTVVLGESDRDAEELFDTYVAVAPPGVAGTRLDRRRKVVFLWDETPTETQREFMYLCTLDAQE